MQSTLDAFIDQVVRTLDRYQRDNKDWQLRVSAYLEGLFTTMHAETVQEVKRLVMLEIYEMLPPTIRQMLVEALENNGYLPPPRNAGQVEIAEIEHENRQVSQSVSQSISVRQSVSSSRKTNRWTPCLG